MNGILLGEIIKDLIAKSKEGMVNWVESGARFEYMVYLDKYSINIKEKASDDIALQYVLKIYGNRHGEEIHKFIADKEEYRSDTLTDEPAKETTHTDSYFTLLKELYAEARDSCHKVDEAFNLISKEINTEGKIGTPITGRIRSL